MDTTERAKWLADRRTGIGGTDIAAILSLSPYAGPIDVWMDKKSLSTPKTETPEMRMGKKMESVIRELYEEETGFTVIQPGLCVHDSNPIIIGTPDGLVSPTSALERRILEIKTSRSSQGWGEAGTDQIPQHYLLQCIHYMAVCDCDYADVAVLIGGSDFRIYNLQRDVELERYLIETATAWWQKHIVGGVAPEIDGSEGAKRYLNYAYPRNVTPLKEATAEINELLALLLNLRTELDLKELEKSKIENQIKAFVGDGDGVEGINSKATWKLTKNSVKTDWEGIGVEYMESLPSTEAEGLRKKHTTTKPGARRFLLTTMVPALS
jgi:putative phage-type endonuclease